mgnify:FL=1
MGVLVFLSLLARKSGNLFWIYAGKDSESKLLFHLFISIDERGLFDANGIATGRELFHWDWSENKKVIYSDWGSKVISLEQVIFQHF